MFSTHHSTTATYRFAVPQDSGWTQVVSGSQCVENYSKYYQIRLSKQMTRTNFRPVLVVSYAVATYVGDQSLRKADEKVV